VLGLLLVFGTDAAYECFNSGSELSWEITSSCRNVMRCLVVWTGQDGVEDVEQEAVSDLTNACCLLHRWIMGEYLRGRDAADLIDYDSIYDASDSTLQAVLLTKTLATHTNTDNGAIDVIQELNLVQTMTPPLTMTAIALGASQRLPSLTNQEQIVIDDGSVQLTNALINCEKLLRTPILLGYTRCAVRFLWIWPWLLPFALIRPFSEFGEQPVLVLAMVFISPFFNRLRILPCRLRNHLLPCR